MFGKGGKKGKNPALRDPAKQAKNQEVMDSLLPLVASKIDENKGVMKVDVLAVMPDVQALIADIPTGFYKQLGKILLRFTDFFVNLPNGMVGTAKGYETGLIKEDGTLDSSVGQGKQGKGNGVPTAKSPPAAKASPLTGAAKKTLTDAVNQMWTAGMNMDDDTALYLAFSNLQAVRSELKKGRTPVSTPVSTTTAKNPVTQPKAGVATAPASMMAVKKGKGKGVAAVTTSASEGGQQPQINLTPYERQQQKQVVMNRCIEKLQVRPDATLLMTQLIADEVIRANKKGAINKFLHFFQEFPTVFQIEPVENTPQHKITLLSSIDSEVPLRPNKRPRE
eukprot:GEMP01031236.1.p1 GENE.GEMP01031236.1~~GEMP01031236.1.p1  ORF type:complete len:336 (+),score=86.18 GEMP01031236.1:141-1148(+)